LSERRKKSGNPQSGDHHSNEEGPHMADEEKDFYTEGAGAALNESMTPEQAAGATVDQPEVGEAPAPAEESCTATVEPAAVGLHPVVTAVEGATEEGLGMAEAWKEVGNQFAALGAGLAAAFRTGWRNEESRRHLKEMKGGLESLVNELGAAIRESAATPEAQKVKDEAGRAMGTFRSAGEKTVQEIRPKITTALNDLNEEVRKLAGRAKREGETDTGTGDTDTAPDSETQPAEPGKLEDPVAS